MHTCGHCSQQNALIQLHNYIDKHTDTPSVSERLFFQDMLRDKAATGLIKFFKRNKIITTGKVIISWAYVYKMDETFRNLVIARNYRFEITYLVSIVLSMNIIVMKGKVTRRLGRLKES